MGEEFGHHDTKHTLTGADVQDDVTVPELYDGLQDFIVVPKDLGDEFMSLGGWMEMEIDIAELIGYYVNIFSLKFSTSSGFSSRHCFQLGSLSLCFIQVG